MLLSAFVGNVLGTMTSMRFSCLIGAVLAFIAIIFTAAATNIYVVIVFFGLIGGQYMTSFNLMPINHQLRLLRRQLAYSDNLVLTCDPPAEQN